MVPYLQQLYKGEVETSMQTISTSGHDGSQNWAVIDGSLYDLSEYFNTLNVQPDSADFKFLDPDLKSLFELHAREDILDLKKSTVGNSLNCMQQAFLCLKCGCARYCQMSSIKSYASYYGDCALLSCHCKFSRIFEFQPCQGGSPAVEVCRLPNSGLLKGEQEIRRAVE